MLVGDVGSSLPISKTDMNRFPRKNPGGIFILVKTPRHLQPNSRKKPKALHSCVTVWRCTETACSSIDVLRTVFASMYLVYRRTCRCIRSDFSTISACIHANSLSHSFQNTFQRFLHLNVMYCSTRQIYFRNTILLRAQNKLTIN